jgi:hypothetical protein
MTTAHHVMTMYHRPFVGLAGIILLLTGCSMRIGGKPTAADDVRAENLQLKKQVAQLSDDLQLRTDQVAVLRKQIDGGENAMPGAETPMLTAISFERYSGAVDTDGDKVDDQVCIYVKTQDQHGRMLLSAGKAVLQVVHIPSEGEPLILAKRHYDPRQWHEAYRSGLLGSYHSLELNLPDDLGNTISSGAGGGSIDVTIKVSFTHGRTGIVYAAEMADQINR